MSITISIVSHNHGVLATELLQQIADFSEIECIILTYNLKNDNIYYPTSLSGKIIEVHNELPKGFSSNHNHAFFKHCNTKYFVVLNPDLYLPMNPFPEMLKTIVEENCFICAPKVVNSGGTFEDSARFFPTPLHLVLKIFGFDASLYPIKKSSLSYPDWVAGMFMFINSTWFKDNPFDDDYFLYYEDIDLCLRCWRSGGRVIYNDQVCVVHDARRDSHRKLSYLLFHIRSILTFFYKHYLRFPSKSLN